jgi:hypothetical protein
MAYLRPRKPALVARVSQTGITPLARHIKCKEILAMSTWTTPDNRATEVSFSDRTAMVQHSLLLITAVCRPRRASSNRGLVKLRKGNRGNRCLTSHTMHTRLRKYTSPFTKLHHHHRFPVDLHLRALHRCSDMHYHPSLKRLPCTTMMFEPLLYKPFLHKHYQPFSN